ncbi:MAG: phosphate ABC transporter permease PstA [Azospirillaceae bacterium]
MTDTSLPAAAPERRSVHTSDAAQARLRKRYAAERRFKLYGIIAVAAALGFLATLLATITAQGYTAFVQTEVRLDVYLDPEVIDPEGSRDPARLQRVRYGNLAEAALIEAVGGVEAELEDDLTDMLSNGAQVQIRDLVMADPELIGETVNIWVLVNSNVDQAFKGNTPRDVPEDRRRVNDAQYAFMDQLEADGRLGYSFNSTLFTSADSRQPELAGLWGAIKGSFFALMVCLILSFPVGIGAAIYLEEFAPKNRLTDLIEVNINNLAAVPSIIFGLLGLAVFIQIFGLPRSAPLVGGMVLALMTLPTIIIAARASLKAVPPSIREAALGIGASKLQSIFHHVLPLALPGMLTGTIIGMAQALGETAPLLMIGMNAFITQAPGGILDPATALPSQIYVWADSSERGFVERTSAGIMVLVGFLILMNALAIYLRKRFERRW